MTRPPSVESIDSIVSIVSVRVVNLNHPMTRSIIDPVNSVSDRFVDSIKLLVDRYPPDNGFLKHITQ